MPVVEAGGYLAIVLLAKHGSRGGRVGRARHYHSCDWAMLAALLLEILYHLEIAIAN